METAVPTTMILAAEIYSKKPDKLKNYANLIKAVNIVTETKRPRLYGVINVKIIFIF